MIIGLSGYARAGKDTVGAYLVERFGFERVAFADGLRNTLVALDPMVGAIDHPSGSEAVYLTDALERFGSFEALKSSEWLSDEWRRLQQRMGTEVGREMFGENVWVDLALKDTDPDKNYVVTDCRFPNEAAGVRSRGGQVWRVNRTGFTATNAHVSETALDNHPFDWVVENDGSLSDLYAKVNEMMATL